MSTDERCKLCVTSWSPAELAEVEDLNLQAILLGTLVHTVAKKKMKETNSESNCDNSMQKSMGQITVNVANVAGRARKPAGLSV